MAPIRGFDTAPLAMLDEATKLDIAKDYLRQTYGVSGSRTTADLVGLRRLMTTIAESGGAFDSVTITGSGFEGESSQGQVVFEPLAYLGAILAVLRELDPDNVVEPPASATFADFRGGCLET